MQDPGHLLKEYWGYTSFRPLQKEIIASVLKGNDTLALLPTGGGKSLCYQIPALMKEGICLVISPLIALMKDQVENLNKKGILSAAIYSGMSRRAIVQVLKNVAYGPYKLLYVSPERLETSLFKEFLPAMNVNLVAIDEAHCISQWGYDFRPSYLRISALREELPGVPVLALTASATPLVQKDICEKLSFPAQTIFRQPFQRPNLSYSVFPIATKLAKMVEILNTLKGSAIIYCKSRKRTVEIYNLLHMHGISSFFYHAGLTTEERSKRQEDWMQNKVRVMVSTNAFGMGIDKPDVGLVLHADCPESLEYYYQEAGRAGRDGKRAYAVLLYDSEDIALLRKLHEKKYPDFDQIKEVYHALVNFLQVPAYSGEGISYPFNFETFIKNFRLDPVIAFSSLKVLEADGWIDFNERSFFPSQVVFTTNKQELYSFEDAYPQFEPLLTTLLRTYEGIFDVPAMISERKLGSILRIEEQAVKHQLNQLTAYRVLQYNEQNDQPQIIFSRHRVPVDHFHIDLKKHNERKKLFIQRVKQMIDYTVTSDCRSLYINRYFGDQDKSACGICDNCLERKRKALKADEFIILQGRIETIVKANRSTVSDLVQQLSQFEKEKIWSAIAYLETEQKLRLSPEGVLIWQ